MKFPRHLCAHMVSVRSERYKDSRSSVHSTHLPDEGLRAGVPVYQYIAVMLKHSNVIEYVWFKYVRYECVIQNKRLKYVEAQLFDPSVIKILILYKIWRKYSY